MSKSKRTIVIALLVTFVIAVAGCGKGGNKENAAGKTTVTIAGSTSVQPLSDELAKAYSQKNPHVTINVQGGGSSQGIKAAADGIAQIGASSRGLKESEKGKVKEILIAIDGIAIVVNPGNVQVANLSMDQVRDIFSGKITNWKDVGGNDAAISVVTREAGSGTRGAFEEIVMHDAKITDRAITQASNGAVRTTVAGDQNAIGYLSLGYLSTEVKGIKVDNVDPTVENIKNGTYKVKRPFLYLTSGEPAGEVKAYIDFVLSPEGQQIVSKHYIPVK
ncbi:MAG: phosphate ABC transporter substrate-binding protein [Peptococcaceae bacterium]|nr:phosphate ABC transporter substrate-binding protein [Peptococcaceae bacterium]